MKTLISLTRRLNTMAQMLQKPHLFRLMREGGSPRQYLALDQPWLHALGIRTILDIGANRGDFTRTISALLPSARIIGFEPLPGMRQSLEALAAANPRFTPVFCGLGEANDELTFNELALDASSSFLKPNAVLTHAEAAVAAVRTTIPVPVRRLDDLAPDLQLEDPLLIKLDVQGFEDRVIRGGHATFHRACALLIETSIVPLYESAPDFDSVYAQLRALGFAYAGTLERLVTLPDGSIASEDTLFVRRPAE
jgi:FkbM family methyltransferase